MLHEFLQKNKKEILALTEEKSLDLAGARLSSDLLKQGLPIFYQQLMTVLEQEERSRPAITKDTEKMAIAATENNEPKMAMASGRPNEAGMAETAGRHGAELLRLGYTLSHVVHAYGAMCQSITELAAKQKAPIKAEEFHDLNRCLDVAIAGAVTEYQSLKNAQNADQQLAHLGFLAHELRNALTGVNISIRLIKRGTVGFNGSVGDVLEKGLKRLENLIDRSLAEVRLSVDPEIHLETTHILQIVDQIMVTAEVEASAKNQKFDIQVNPNLEVRADLHLLFSALSNLIQNAIKYTRGGGTIQIRAKQVDREIVMEIEDECGGLPPGRAEDLFKPYEQKNENREGLGLGLTISRRAIALNHGNIRLRDLPGKGCVFTVNLPIAAEQRLPQPA